MMSTKVLLLALLFAISATLSQGRTTTTRVVEVSKFDDPCIIVYADVGMNGWTLSETDSTKTSVIRSDELRHLLRMSYSSSTSTQLNPSEVIGRLLSTGYTIASTVTVSAERQQNVPPRGRVVSSYSASFPYTVIWTLVKK